MKEKLVVWGWVGEVEGIWAGICCDNSLWDYFELQNIGKSETGNSSV